MECPSRRLAFARNVDVCTGRREGPVGDPERARWMAREVGAGGSFLPNASVFLVL